MLQGRFEWTIGVVGIAVVATIAAWYSVVWARHVEQASGPEAPAVVSPLPIARAEPPAAAPTVPPAPVRPASVPRPARITFIASRGGSWLQVRSGSHAGRLLYDGTVSQGAKLRFRSPRLWVRLGSGSNLDIWVNSRPARTALFGTYDAFVTARGVRPDPVFHPDPVQATAAQSP